MASGQDVFIKIKNLPGAALSSSHASTKKLRRGTSVQLGLNSRLHDIRLPRAPHTPAPPAGHRGERSVCGGWQER